MSTDAELADALAGVLRTGPITDLARLSGGASRQTWSFTAGGRRLVLQRQRVAGWDGRGVGLGTEAEVLRAAAAGGVPAAEVVVASDDPTPLGAPFLVMTHVDGETIARKIQRDDTYQDARLRFAGDCGAALARLHTIPADAVTGLTDTDELTRYREQLDAFGDPHPAFELAFRWLEANRPASHRRAIVHGDFRLGNLMIGPDGLRAVLDWELVHVGDPNEDLGWLCVKAWRFGRTPPVGGLGSYEELFEAYEAAGGGPVDAAVVRWWEVLGTLKWGIMCKIQAASHLLGLHRSHEHAAIGRRVCENEHDVLALLP